MSDITRGDGASSSAGALHARVQDASGNAASIVSLHAGDNGAQQAMVQLEDGRRVLVPANLLVRQDDGSYLLPFTFQGTTAHMRIPVIQEELHVDKRRVDTGRGVRLHKSVEQREELIDQPLLHDELVVEHVPVGRMVKEDEVPLTRYEGETLVLPVFEEVLVVQKQLMLKEEVRVTRRQREVHAPQKVTLRSEQVKVERFE
ncbi:YsnF/AvaK domain-containing protein [Noviherbaspirillum aridicola]|uniref:DUF2382 domain-containing protein n=1 Tax=Noviherbaspirillum aridicola TaxID=2849687 RepID=A0ABQ4Q3E5_9BURK|nr:YsnF/AvaK domain-containing protein [Noviherbaspirillum aridicola]GIZ51708.1 hypothetical protein NCCP691_17220 [Noviherbaspirillum aridicola]